jgi:lysophospholipase L1-like esterase
VVDPGAARSGRNYAHQLARRLGLDLIDATVSGATTTNILSEPQTTPVDTKPPQLDSLPADADLVTVTAGGNDVGYIGAVIQRWFGAVARREGRFAAWSAEQAELAPDPAAALALLPVVQERLVEVVRAVRARAPAARVVLVDYLTVLGPDLERVPDLPLQAAEVSALRRLGHGLAAATGAAARESGAELVAASRASLGHGVGSALPWVTADATGDALRAEPVPFHPNLAGMTAVADLLAAQLSGWAR